MLPRLRIVLASALLTLAAPSTGLAQQAPQAGARVGTSGILPEARPGRHISATGRTMPPATGNAGASLKPGTEAEMLKAQRAAAERDKAWDAKMRRTLGSICTGC